MAEQLVWKARSDKEASSGFAFPYELHDNIEQPAC
jgi:hypothetical protein